MHHADQVYHSNSTGIQENLVYQIATAWKAVRVDKAQDVGVKKRECLPLCQMVTYGRSFSAVVVTTNMLAVVQMLA